MLAAEWTDDDGQPLHPVAYSVGGYYGPILPRGHARADTLAGRAGEARRARGGSRGRLPRAARDLARRRVRLAGARARGAPRSASASPSATRTPTPRARSAACSNSPARTDAATTATSPIRSGSRIGSCRRSPPTSPRRMNANGEAGARRTRAAAERDDPEKQARREQRERDYEERVSARARNLDLGAALAKLGAEARHRRGEAARLARAPALRQGGSLGASALRRAADRRRTSRAR